MTTTMTESRIGAQYGTDAQRYDTLAYLAGEDTLTEYDRDLMADALLDALRAKVDELLPEGTTWQPDTSALLHPDGEETPDGEELPEIFAAAWEAVEGRYAEIEQATLGGLPATLDGLEAALQAIEDPIRRARVAGLLASSDAVGLAARVRGDAVEEATRQGLSRQEVADLLGTGLPAINKIMRGRRRAS
ncbi:hypothetical protein [Melissospora conviva]|uniref:hypothetical protein n=1 Tax=Melissospora conviva TaxID=3388432 RepID=UPI003C265E71